MTAGLVVVVKITIFVIPCILVEFYRRFGDVYYLYLQDLKVNQTISKKQGQKQNLFLAWITLWTWRWQYFPPKHRWNIDLHDVTSHEIELFIVTSLRTPNPKEVCLSHWVKVTNFGHVIPCSVIQFYRGFIGMYCLCLQGWQVCQVIGKK